MRLPQKHMRQHFKQEPPTLRRRGGRERAFGTHAKLDVPQPLDER